MLAAAALATSSVILGGLAVERHLASDSEVNVIITHTDPELGEQWGYEIRRGGKPSA